MKRIPFNEKENVYDKLVVLQGGEKTCNKKTSSLHVASCCCSECARACGAAAERDRGRERRENEKREKEEEGEGERGRGRREKARPVGPLRAALPLKYAHALK